MKYKNIIFDFDGVLAESHHIKTNAFYKLYEKYDKVIAEKVVEHHKANSGMSRYAKLPYYHKEFLNIELSEKEFNEVSNNFSDLVVKDVINSEEVPGASWFLKKYNNSSNYWIVSATPTDEINVIISKRGMLDYFISVCGSPEKKSFIVKNIIYKNKLNTNDTVFLGDAMSDYKAAMDNNINFILRQTNENKSLFQNYPGLIRFSDFHELSNILKRMT